MKALEKKLREIALIECCCQSNFLNAGYLDLEEFLSGALKQYFVETERWSYMN